MQLAFVAHILLLWAGTDTLGRVVGVSMDEVLRGAGSEEQGPVGLLLHPSLSPRTLGPGPGQPLPLSSCPLQVQGSGPRVFRILNFAAAKNWKSGFLHKTS